MQAEYDVLAYEILYSADGINFAPIGSRNATGSSEYSLMHNSPRQGLNFYRLKTIDTDGKLSYSQIRKVNFGKGGQITIFPIPTNNNVNITFSAAINKTALVKVLAMDGRTVLQKQWGAVGQTESLDVSKLSGGQYVLHIAFGDEIIYKQLSVIK